MAEFFGPSLLFKRKICEIFKQAYDFEVSCVCVSLKVKKTLVGGLKNICTAFHSNTRKPATISDHILKCDSCKGALKCKELSYKTIEILDKCRTKFNCDVKEAFLVEEQLKTKINGQLFQNEASRTLIFA